VKKSDLERLSDAELEHAWKEHQADDAALKHAKAVGRRTEPFAGLDKFGMPPADQLARLETNAFRRLNPRRRRWEKLAGFDERVAELEQRHAAVQAHLSELLEQQRTAPDRDAEALAEWHLAGAKGERPASEVDSLAEAVRAAERDRDALQTAVESVLAEKERYVVGHRAKLAADAAKDVAAARTRYANAIVGLEVARGQLVDSRLTELWALTYPAAAAAREPQFLGSLARNLVDRLRRAGVAQGVDVAQLGRLLREDVEAVATAVDPEQRAVIEGHEGRSAVAVWANTDEGREVARQEKQAVIDAHIREWGHPPSEWDQPVIGG
jgi:hypothetical protein